MSHSYSVKSRFHIGYSLLGRQIRRRQTDEHYAEGIFIIAFAILLVGLIVFNFLGWGFIQPFLSGPSAESITLFFWIGQVISTLLFFSVCMLGFKPAIEVKVQENKQLSIKQGKQVLQLPLDVIQSVTQISALRFHRHYRKYANTRAFFVKIPSSLILLNTEEGPIVLGLPQEEQQELLPLLQPQSEKIVFSTLSPIA